MVGTYSESSCNIKILQMEFRIESNIMFTTKPLIDLSDKKFKTL